MYGYTYLEGRDFLNKLTLAFYTFKLLIMHLIIHAEGPRHI